MSSIKTLTPFLGKTNWLDDSVEGYSQTSKTYKSFERKLSNYIKSNTGLTLVSPVKGHYYSAGILKNEQTGKFVYFSIGDVRYYQDEWYTKVLYRTCKHEKDWTGGWNQYCDLEDLPEKLCQSTL